MTEKFLIQFDSINYKNKPSGTEIAKIKVRVQNSEPQKLTAIEIKDKIEKGYSFSLGILKDGLKAENWVEQQLFAVDIDNDNENEQILTPKKAIEMCENKGLRPLIFYQSFSFTKKIPKYRLIFALDKPIVDIKIREIISKTLVNLFQQSDKSCVNADRIFFGTNKQCKCGNNMVTVDKFLELYNSKSEAKYIETVNANEFEKLKNNFDFEKYLKYNLKLEVLSENNNSIKFKECPICSHNECFVYYKKTKTFYCFGKNGNRGGGIIDFLMITRNLSKNDAIKYFKKQLCCIEDEKPIHIPVPLYSAYDLMQKNIPEPYFSVENLIYQGLTILAAPPKGYKSWLILYLCLCIAKGVDFLGFKTKKSSVVYFALEDSDRRVRKRLQKISDNNILPKNYYLVHKAVNLEGGFVADLEYYLKHDPEIKLFVIDTLQVVRGMYKNQNAYAKDYEDVRALKTFADKHGVCIVVVHHVKKDNKKDDLVFNRISGTNGILGAADTALILDLTDKDLREFTLHITGRDVEPDDLTLQFNDGRWLCLGNAEVQAKKREQKEYEENDLTIAVKRMLRQEEKWQGNATDLKKLLIQYGCDCNLTVPVMAKKLKKLTDLFNKYDNIIYTPAKSSNGKRIHKFEISSFGTGISELLKDSGIDDIFESDNIS